MTHALAPEQLDLFGAVIGAYLADETQTNDELYRKLEASGHVSAAELAAKVPVGRAGVGYSPVKTRIRWWQQRLKEQGIIERVPEQRGTWRLADRDKHGLTKAPPKVMMLAHSTDLGAAVWGSCFDFFGGFNESIAVCITSPPYPLAKPRHYGNPSESEWVDFVCRALEPIVKRLLPGGSIAVNVSNDVHERGLPSRSIYRERFVVAMVERFGLHKMDDMPWVSNKAPAPYQWSSRKRMLLRTGFEPVLVFCNDPLKSFASNERVLRPHTEAHKRLIESGGEKSARVNSDGAYRVRKGAYSNPTAGRIPTNVLSFGTACADQRRMRKMASAAGLPTHGASMPLALAMFLVEYLSRPGDLVVDPFGGSLTTAKACEELGRLWVAVELMAEYLMCGRFRFGVGPSSSMG
jgi:DNA modification methylase